MTIEVLTMRPDSLIADLLHSSSGIVRHLAGQGIEIIPVAWDGTILDMEGGVRKLIHVTTDVRCDPHDLARLCQTFGHIAFFYDRLLRLSGKWDPDHQNLIKAVNKLIVDNC